MYKSLWVRLLVLALTMFALAPAAIAVLKCTPPFVVASFRGMYHPIWWWRWVWSWMPALRLPWNSWNNFYWSLPGLVAIAGLGAGLGLLLRGSRRLPRRSWEDEP